MSKVISKQDYYKLLGLGVLAKQYCNSIDDVTAAIADIVGETNESGYFGHASDCIWDNDPASYIVKAMEIEVLDNK